MSWRPKAPPRRGGGLWTAFSKMLAVVVILAATVLIGGVMAVYEFNRAGPSTQTEAFLVERGSSAAAIGERLAGEGLIRDPLFFRLALRAYAQGRSLQAGEYEVPAGASLRRIVEMMAGGEAVQHAVTIPEGYTIQMVMEVLAASEVLTGDLPETPPEGSILPETYHVQRGMTRTALLQQMRAAHDAAVAEIWARRQPDLPISTPEQMVTLASIVERETGVAAERPMVASAFINRLRRPMRLESDPTIIYGVCIQAPARCRNGRLVDAAGNPRVIRQSDMAMRTGYNTYQIDGLPPTPIANPGRASLEAVADPPDSDAIFFVADGTGGHVFAATLNEHLANVARWREVEAKRLAEERLNR